jgi:hypothetical protein
MTKAAATAVTGDCLIEDRLTHLRRTSILGPLRWIRYGNNPQPRHESLQDRAKLLEVEILNEVLSATHGEVDVERLLLCFQSFSAIAEGEDLMLARNTDQS